MSTIVYASDFDPITAYIKKLCGREEISCKTFTAPISAEIEVVLLGALVKIDNQYWDISELWQAYLKKAAPQTKLIIIGLDDSASANYIDCLQPIPSLKETINKAKRVKENIPSVQYFTPSLLKLLRNFLEGHGNESIRQALMRVHRITKMAENERDNFGTSTSQIWKDLLLPNQVENRWHTFVNRWEYYYPLFHVLPFYSYFEEINKIILSVNKALDNQQALLTSQSRISEDFEAVKEWLKKIEQYVYR